MSPKVPRPKKPKEDSLRVRMYNVLFGDAILVSLFEGGTARHILIDVGNVTGVGGDVAVFKPVIEDIYKELDGQPLDLYVMTHEHMDHVKGLLYGHDRLGLDSKATLRAKQAWLTASSATDYYDTHDEARKKKLAFDQDLRAVRRLLIASHLDKNPGTKVAGDSADDLINLLSKVPDAMPPRLAALLLNNDFQSTGKCVEYLRALADSASTHYVHREYRHPSPPDLGSASVEIWGPEEDTSVYYGRLRPLAFGLADPDGPEVVPELPRLSPPPGVDAGAFFDLVESRRRGFGENLLSIDKAANNTSVVFCLEWNGWRLLFPGDAEEKSWAIMDKNGQVKGPVDFLKIGHHGSHNGTPSGAILDKLLPLDGSPRFAAVCTCAGVYGDSEATAVPHGKTLTELGRRCKVSSVQGLPPGGYLDLTFPPKRPGKVALKTSAIPTNPGLAGPGRPRHGRRGDG